VFEIWPMFPVFREPPSKLLSGRLLRPPYRIHCSSDHAQVSPIELPSISARQRSLAKIVSSSALAFVR
jgi:hypothetical protein